METIVEAILLERKTVSACSMVSTDIVRYTYVALFDLYPFLLKNVSLYAGSSISP